MFYCLLYLMIDKKDFKSKIKSNYTYINLKNIKQNPLTKRLLFESISVTIALI